MKEIPQTGWFILKEDNGLNSIIDVKIYYDGKQISNVTKLSIDFDVEKFTPILKLEIIPSSLALDASFKAISALDSIKITSSMSPEEVLKNLDKEKGI